MVPKVRQGGYISFFVTEHKRSEAALIQVIQEAFVQGVSTRTRPLFDTIYPVLWVDALYEKALVNGRIVSMAVLVVFGVDEHGRREVLAVEPMVEESRDIPICSCSKT